VATAGRLARHEHYDELVRLLSKRARVIVLELPGFGFSPARPGFDFALESSVASAGMALDSLGLRGVTLCFPCASAYIALALAQARPELVSRLLVAQAPAYSGELAWKQRRDPRGVLGRPVWGQLVMRALSKRRLPAWFSLSVGDRSRLQSFTELAAQRLNEGARWSLASAFQRYLVEGVAPAAVEQPVIALWGERDRSHQGTDRASSRSLGRRVEVVRWADVGHFPELEAPERFVELLRAGPWPG
jgi:pimeloyl-ACP methyl ester carboxylesterase